MIGKRVEVLEEAIKLWLQSHALSEAVEKTVESKLFYIADVYYAIEHLKKSLESGDLKKWVQTQQVFNLQDGNQTILCLHAGNLPLVGFQDMLAVLLSGANYAGKISKKDPFLIPSFLNLLKQLHPNFIEKISFSVDLNDFSGLDADFWMFAGSEESLIQIRSSLEALQIVKPDSDSLLRVAHFSIAVLNRTVSRSNLVDFVESILRYNGKGCRSVAIVFTDIKLSDISGDLSRIGREWLVNNGREHNPEAILKWRYAYNAAVNIDQVWVGNALIQVGHPVVGHNQHVYWQPLESFRDLLNQYGTGIQQIYLTQKDDFNDYELFSEKLDYLGNSQTPQLYWKPDGIDPLEWILTR